MVYENIQQSYFQLGILSFRCIAVCLVLQILYPIKLQKKPNQDINANLTRKAINTNLEEIEIKIRK